MLRDNAENYHVQYFFVGTDGWSERAGFTNRDSLRAQAVRDMARACEDVVVLTESEKFATAGTIPLNLKDIPMSVITDDKIPQDIVSKVEAQGIHVRR